LQILEDTGKILVLPVLCTSITAGCFILSKSRRYWKILENTGNTSIADIGRFWKILVIPVLQTLEDSEKYWLYQYCRYWKILENTGNTSIVDTGQ
jgi:hypothetical protein